MSAIEARELKQQGAIEAAQDPQSLVTAEDAERVLVEQAKSAGVPGFSFDPNASIEEKRAQVAAVGHIFSPHVFVRICANHIPRYRPSLPDFTILDKTKPRQSQLTSMTVLAQMKSSRSRPKQVPLTWAKMDKASS